MTENQIIECGWVIAYHRFGFDPGMLEDMHLFPSAFFEVVPREWAKPTNYFMRDPVTHAGFVFNPRTGKAALCGGKEYWDDKNLKEYRSEYADKNYPILVDMLKEWNSPALKLLSKFENEKEIK
jgi:hypothetical protein